MTVKYGEILRLASKGFSLRNIALSVPARETLWQKLWNKLKSLI